ncbi:MAG: prepilin peptidase [Candidatus Ozemobacteraceae bacterium]
MPETTLPPFAYGYFVCLFFLFGSLLGSFCNVVVLRMASGRSVVFPPSECPACHHRLSPRDLIPIFGWILLRGKCRYCGVAISPQYPMVEAATATIFASAFIGCGFRPSLLTSAAWGIYWLVVTVLAFRGEVRKPAPFLWPLAFFPAFSWFSTGKFSLSEAATALGFALVAAFIAGVRFPERACPQDVVCVPDVSGMKHVSGVYRPAWFGVGSIGCLALTDGTFSGPILLLVAACVQRLVPVSGESGPRRERLPLLIWSLVGAVICAVRGTWGFGPLI